MGAPVTAVPEHPILGSGMHPAMQTYWSRCITGDTVPISGALRHTLNMEHQNFLQSVPLAVDSSNGIIIEDEAVELIGIVVSHDELWYCWCTICACVDVRNPAQGIRYADPGLSPVQS